MVRLNKCFIYEKMDGAECRVCSVQDNEAAAVSSRNSNNASSLISIFIMLNKKKVYL